MKEKYRNELERIKKERGLTAENVLEEAKDKENPLHELFDWKDREAAKKWRLHQSRMLVLKVRVEYKGKKVPEYIQVTVDKDGNSKQYKTKADISGNKDWKQQVLREAMERIKYWRTKYEYLDELDPIFDGIDKVEGKL